MKILPKLCFLFCIPMLTVVSIIWLFNAGYYSYSEDQFINTLTVILIVSLVASSVMAIYIINYCRAQRANLPTIAFLSSILLTVIIWLSNLALCVFNILFISANTQ